MKCNVKGHRLDGNVFGDVYPVFLGKKFKASHETERKIMERELKFQRERELSGDRVYKIHIE